jgi:hypothetical protein
MKVIGLKSWIVLFPLISFIKLPIAEYW